MNCKNCSKEIPNDSEYCPFCGNVSESTIVTKDETDLNKGYTYLELKQWDDAEQFFREAIINGADKSEAYIGKMLAQYRVNSIEELVTKGKNFGGNDNFKFALKYANGNQETRLQEYVLSANKKYKRKVTVLSSVIAGIAIIAALMYFVVIPFTRISNYEKLLESGKIQKAVKTYKGNKWFEYDDKAKDLFYATGLELIEEKDYKNAQSCFEITKGYTDNKKYLDYCKAQNLLANNDLESYNYFVNLGEFLDSKEILATNEHFVIVNKLQGKWEYPETPMSVIDDYMTDNGYVIKHKENLYYKEIEENGHIGYVKERTKAERKSIEIKGLVVSGDFSGTIDFDTSDIGIGIYDGYLWSRLEEVENTTMRIAGKNGSGIYACVEWTRAE